MIADSTEAFNRQEGRLTPAGCSDEFDFVNPVGVRTAGRPDLSEGFRTHLKECPETRRLEPLVVTNENGYGVIAAALAIIRVSTPGNE